MRKKASDEPARVAIIEKVVRCIIACCVSREEVLRNWMRQSTDDRRLEV